MERYDVVTATFLPQRTDDLRPVAVAWIGVSADWMASWMIEEEDGGAYVGQWAMTLYGPTPAAPPWPGWVPLCDLEVA
jgi:hypothetical protein